MLERCRPRCRPQEIAVTHRLRSRLLANVAFAFGSRPGVPEQDALELAHLLSGRRSLAGNSAAEKIREQARRDFESGEASYDVELTGDELVELSTLLAGEPWPREQTGSRIYRKSSTATSAWPVAEPDTLAADLTCAECGRSPQAGEVWQLMFAGLAIRGGPSGRVRRLR